MTNSRRRAALCFMIDVVAVALFVVIGRRNHHEAGNVLFGASKIAAPFLIALVVGWVVGRSVADADRAPLTNRVGLVVWACTVVLGLALRRIVFQRGTAIAFIIVATITLGVFLLGWRAVARVMARGTV
jgi:hypothetical protein